MKDLKTINELIDRAAEKVGSDRKLSEVLKVPAQVISNWRHGQRTCTPEDVTLLAFVAGLDPEAWLVRAVIEKHKGTAKGERLLKALGKKLPVIGEVTATYGAGAMVICLGLSAWLGELIPYSTMYNKTRKKAQSGLFLWGVRVDG